VLRFVGMVFKRWDERVCRGLVERFKLPLERRVKELSRGETAKLSLTVALSHGAEVLILDEPTVGLDPLIRRQFTDVLLEEMARKGTTVLFSTHILTDLENIADTLILIKEGRLAAAGKVEELRGRFRKASYVFGSAPAEGLAVPGALRVAKGIREWVALFPAEEGICARAGAAIGAKDIVEHPVTLDEVFVELLEKRA
jgi:ABC-2 type transport system ATP-binding protein